MRNREWFDRMQALGKRLLELTFDVRKALEDDKQESDGLYEALELLEQAGPFLGLEIDRTYADMNRK